MNGTDPSIPLLDPELEWVVQMLKAWVPGRHEHQIREQVIIAQALARNMATIAKRGPIRLADPGPDVIEIDGERHRV
ncbi:hypothetical protein [Acidiphilium angustum]|uniref:hypothetical protein n=1 Tax=Acidiphilium angustum TaxID=523 RepID=UPI00049471DF|nr:hypothetical protein [Acidiphilium angustum]